MNHSYAINYLLKNPRAQIIVSVKKFNASGNKRYMDFYIHDGNFLFRLNQDIVDICNNVDITLSKKENQVIVKGGGINMVWYTLHHLFKNLGIDNEPHYATV